MPKTTQEYQEKTKLANERVDGRKHILPKDLLDLFPNLIFILSPAGTIVEINREVCRTLGVDEKVLLDSSFIDLCSSEDREQVRVLLEECCQSGQMTSRQVKLVTQNGTAFDVLLSLNRYPQHPRKQQCYCVIIGRDVSEEKKKELDLLRFSNIAHYTVNPVEVTDPNGSIIYVNPAFEKASGYTKEEVIGKTPKIFGSGKHPKSFWKQMWDTITSGKVWVGEIENRRRNGDPFFTQLLISPIIDGENRIVGYFGVHRDITEVRHLKQQLIQAQKMESIGMLAAGIAHEVGNPLTSISSIVQVIQRTTQDEFTQEKLELIKSQVARISKIIRDLVDFSRRSSYEVQMTDINKSIYEAVEIVRIGKKAKDIAIHFDLTNTIPSLPLVPDQIEQVFINILINAVDAIKAKFGGVTARGKTGEIVVRSMTKDNNVVVEIQDNGKGISEEHFPKIFEPFFTTKQVGEGTGLGLWVSYGIIKSFEGNITVESVQGEGTKFIVTLPMHTELT